LNNLSFQSTKPLGEILAHSKALENCFFVVVVVVVVVVFVFARFSQKITVTHLFTCLWPFQEEVILVVTSCHRNRDGPLDAEKWGLGLPW